jgi:PAS domain S-box-containing protein
MSVHESRVSAADPISVHGRADGAPDDGALDDGAPDDDALGDRALDDRVRLSVEAMLRIAREKVGPVDSDELVSLFGTILDTNPDILCLIDLDGTILRFSGAQETILGYPSGYLAGRRLVTLVHPDDSPALQAEFEKLANGDAVRFEIRYRLGRADGMWTTLSTRGRAILDEDGKPLAVVATSRDVTNDVQQEQKLLLAVSNAEQANKAKSEFLSRMSHELRTPLNSVLGFAQLLEMDELSNSQTEAVEHILRAGRHLLGLIDEVLDISRIETGNLELQMEPVELRSLVNDAVGLTSPMAERASVFVSVVGSLDESACVYADRQRLLQVMLNLLSNAVKYNAPGGKIRVTCEALRGGHIGVAVSDTGVGIKEDDMSLLFEPFERLGAERIGIEGAGVGLTIAKNLVERMGGVLDVFSRVGEGSTFEVVLKEAEPPSEQTRQVASQKTNEVAEGRAMCVLLIEDNLANLTLIENLLVRRNDVRLLAAMHGTLGLDLAKEHRPDLVLLDLHLPDQSGADVLQRLKEDPETADIPVVVVSADRSTDKDRQMRALGAADYLVKPFDVRDLLRTVDHVLNSSAASVG